ncbi:MAG: DUF4428 domain-containing protein [Eggerthellales bacterium]|nr:DUF4428 domain-containing protein [Eggerthellales bacterium]
MGLFDKKYCDICGEKIGLLGNRKLEDGNLCKECAKKLSPWFSDRRRSTVDDIRGQLAYREANQELVESFTVTRTLGTGTRVLFDEDNQRFMVTSARNLREANPDVLNFADCTGCELEVDEDREEVMYRNAEGEEVSFIPPRYNLYYNYYLNIYVNNPYFDRMRFQLSDSRVPSNDRVNQQRYTAMAEEIKTTLMDFRQQVRDQIEQENAPKVATTCPWCGATTTPAAGNTCEYCGGALS